MTQTKFGLASLAIVTCGLLAFAQQAPPAQAPAGPAGRGGAVAATGAPDAPARGQGRGGRAGGAAARKRVLAWADTRNGQAQHDSVGHAVATIEHLGYVSGLWDTYIRTDSNIISKTPKKTDGTPASGGPSLSNVDAIFYMGHREVPLDDSQKTELLQFVRDGHGFVGAHVALTSFASWPEFLDLIGARYAGHAFNGLGTVINERPDFPATKHFPASFPFTDEFYTASEYSRDKIDVLLRLVEPGAAPDKDTPVAWAKSYGKGRVFYSSLSHASATWDIRDVQQMYFEAMKWSLGLTDVEPAPHAMRGAAAPAPARGGGGGSLK
jgi:uncharacterized protein